MIEEAIRYADAGFSVLPTNVVREDGGCSCSLGLQCKSPGKHPITKWEGRSRVEHISKPELRRLFKSYPDANVGIVTGRISNLVVLDVDGEAGMAALTAAGIDPWEVPTPSVKSGGGGYHFYYRYPSDMEIPTRTALFDHVDVRSDGGFIVAPPSIHRSGNTYEWIDGLSLEDLDLAEVDLSWMTQKKPKAPKKKQERKDAWVIDALEGVSEGGRNDTATRLAGHLFHYGLPPEISMAWLRAWNDRNTPPLDQEEIETIVNSIERKEGAEDRMAFASTAFGMDISSVQRITGDEKIYVIKFRDHDTPARIAGSQLMNGRALQSAVFNATNKVVRLFSANTTPTLRSLTQALADSAFEFDTGHESTEPGVFMEWIKDYMRNMRTPTVEPGDKIPSRGPFKMDDRYWLRISEFRSFIKEKYGDNRSIPWVSQMCSEMGLQRIDTKTEDGHTSRVWGVSTEWVDD